MTTRDDGARFTLKPVSEEGIPAAMDKAEHYRLLNEAREAESICRDILRTDPDHEGALRTLLLALTDQFPRDASYPFQQAKELIPRLRSEYDRAYYSGILCERRAKAAYLRHSPGSGGVAYGWLREAMDFYEQARELSPPGNDDAVLRWNACVRMIRTYRDIEPAPEEEPTALMLE